MRRYQHGDTIGLKVADHVEQLEGRLRIEAGGRLVEDRDLGTLHHHLGEAETPLIPCEQVATLLSADIVEAHMLQRIVDMLRRLMAIGSPTAAPV